MEVDDISDRNNLWNIIQNNIFLPVLVTILGLVIWAVVSYFLFGAREDLDRAWERESQIREGLIDAATANKLTDIYLQGSLVKVSSQLATIVHTLYQHPRPRLSHEFISTTERWLTRSRFDLAEEEGRIAGLAFRDNAFNKHVQEVITSHYDVTLELLTSVNDCLDVWGKPSLTTRKTCVAALDDKVSEQFRQIAALKSVLTEARSQNALSNQKLEHLDREQEESLNIIREKSFLSYYGVSFITLLPFVFLIMKIFQRAKRMKRHIEPSARSQFVGPATVRNEETFAPDCALESATEAKMN